MSEQPQQNPQDAETVVNDENGNNDNPNAMPADDRPADKPDADQGDDAPKE